MAEINCFFGAYGTINAGTVSNLRTTEQGNTAVTLAAGEYPTRIVFHTGSDSPGAVVNSHPQTDAYPTARLYLTQSNTQSTSYLLGTWETYNGDEYGYTETGVWVLKRRNRYFIYNGIDQSFSNAKSLAGKTLAIYVAGDSGASFQQVAKVTVYTEKLSYAITVDSSQSDSVQVDKTTATQGETVTIRIKPPSGWSIHTVSATSSSPQYVGLDNGYYKYTFTMPASNVNVAVVYTQNHKLEWESTATLTIEQRDYKLIATLKGKADDTNGHAITYRLSAIDVASGERVFSGTTFGNEANGKRTAEISITDANINKKYTFTAFADCGYSNIGGPKKENYIVKSVHKTVQYYTNGQWVECIAYYRINGSWQEIEPYYYKNGNWIPCSKT